MEAVLGLSLTPTTVGLVLVTGPDAGGAIVGSDAFDVSTGSEPIWRRAAAAVGRAADAAAHRGWRVTGLGVAWGAEVAADAAELVDTLRDRALGRVVTVRLPEAADALARRVAARYGHAETAVCVLEPEMAIAALVGGAGNDVHRAVRQGIETEEQLAEWLAGECDRAGRAPEALVLVGAAGDLEDLVAPLRRQLGVTVHTPRGAELALAHGAALACAEAPAPAASAPGRDRLPDEPTTVLTAAPDRAVRPVPRDTPEPVRRPRPAGLVPAAMLVAGAITFVSSVSAAVSLELTGGDRSAPTRSAPRTVTPQPAAATTPRPAPVPVAPEPVLAEPAESVVETEPAEPVVEPEPQPVVEAAAVEPEPAEQVPAEPEPQPPVE